MRADADGALDASIFTIAGFRHAEMDRIIPIAPELIQMSHEQSVGLDHDLGIAGLHREEEVVIIVRAGDAGKLERTLHHAMRRVAMTVHDAVTEATVIRADAHGATEAFALLHEGHELGLHVGHFFGVLLVGVLLDRELLFVGVVAGIHADFFHPLHSFHGGIWLEVDVSHQRHITACRADAIADVLEILCNDAGLRGDADNLTADGGELEGFFDTGGGIPCVAREHRLHTDGIVSANADVSHHADAGLTALIVVEIGAVFQHRFAKKITASQQASAQT